MCEDEMCVSGWEGVSWLGSCSSPRLDVRAREGSGIVGRFPWTWELLSLSCESACM